MQTRKQLKDEARQAIADSISQADAIRAGLRIASCGAFHRTAATAEGCAREADGMAEELATMYGNSAMLGHRLARLVSRRDWPSLWMAARREVYPQTCR